MRTLTIMMVAFAMMLSAGCKNRSTVQGQAGKKLALETAGQVTIERGGMAKAEIKIHREKLEGPVSINFGELPGGIEVIDADKKIDGSEGTYNLKASDTADLVSGHVAQVTATGPDGIAVTESIKITVTEKK